MLKAIPHKESPAGVALKNSCFRTLWYLFTKFDKILQKIDTIRKIYIIVMYVWNNTGRIKNLKKGMIMKMKHYKKSF